MLWLVLAGALVVATAVIVAFGSRQRQVDLGSVSSQWIAEHHLESH
jgi:hypothetical protein